MSSLLTRDRLTKPCVAYLCWHFGQVTTTYGHVNNIGLTSKGSPFAPVPVRMVSPSDSIIVFSELFRGYGRLLIIEHSEGYHTVLTRMTKVDTEVGQHLFAGKPVSVIENPVESVLYVELRREGQPINPLPWLATRKGNTRG